jgi:hypothetical protein
MDKDQLILDLEVLFEYDDYEEICYPLIKCYFDYKMGKPFVSEYEVKEVWKAYSILGMEWPEYEFEMSKWIE